ncbi:MAG: hypothetical protein ACKVVT_12205 [Dehalococcoidia bacterium]
MVLAAPGEAQPVEHFLRSLSVAPDGTMSLGTGPVVAYPGH